MSSTMCPYSVSSELLWITAWMTTTESPSKTTCLRPISLAKRRALQHAKASKTAIELDRGIGIDNAPIASPLLLQTITPIPAEELCLIIKINNETSSPLKGNCTSNEPSC